MDCVDPCQVSFITGNPAKILATVRAPTNVEERCENRHKEGVTTGGEFK